MRRRDKKNCLLFEHIIIILYYYRTLNILANGWESLLIYVFANLVSKWLYFFVCICFSLLYQYNRDNPIRSLVHFVLHKEKIKTLLKHKSLMIRQREMRLRVHGLWKKYIHTHTFEHQFGESLQRQFPFICLFRFIYLRLIAFNYKTVNEFNYEFIRIPPSPKWQ